MSKAPREVACPACGKLAPFSPDNRFRPFCSERCRVTDLGGWAAEEFRVPGKPAEDADEPGDGGPRG